jgi:hypothetical protein
MHKSLNRSMRDAKLQDADVKVLRFLETGAPVPQAWLDYRQALRDIPQTQDITKLEIVWPTKPE